MKRTPSTRFTVLSWAFVAAVAVLIFCMSAKTGDALDHDSGIISFLLETLRSAANALFGHPVDVSPVGHFAEFFLLGLALHERPAPALCPAKGMHALHDHRKPLRSER